MKTLSLFLFACIILFSVNVNAQEFTAIDSTISGNVNSLVVYNNELYAGGSIYKSISGKRDTFCLMKWDGHTLSFIKDKIFGSHAFVTEISTLIAYKGCLYAGINGVSYMGVWNGEKWDTIHIEGRESARIFTEYQGELYVYTQKGDSGAIYKWDGKTLTNLTAGHSVYVSSMVVYVDKLLIAGVIDSIYREKKGIYRISLGAMKDLIGWDGKTFYSEDSVVKKTKRMWIEYGFIRSMYVLKDTLFVSYESPHHMEISYDFVAYDKNLYSVDKEVFKENQLFNYEVNALCEYNDRIYGGGKFGQRSSEVMEMVAIWRNNEWTTLIGGLGPNRNYGYVGACNYFKVNALCVYKGGLYAGGQNVSVTSNHECCKINCIAKLVNK